MGTRLPVVSFPSSSLGTRSSKLSFGVLRLLHLNPCRVSLALTHNLHFARNNLANSRLLPGHDYDCVIYERDHSSICDPRVLCFAAFRIWPIPMNIFSHSSGNAMKTALLATLLLASTFGGERALFAQPGEIPEALKPWKDWALWDAGDIRSPSPFNDPNQHLRSWPSELSLEIFPDHATWQFRVSIYDEGSA